MFRQLSSISIIVFASLYLVACAGNFQAATPNNISAASVTPNPSPSPVPAPAPAPSPNPSPAPSPSPNPSPSPSPSPSPAPAPNPSPAPAPAPTPSPLPSPSGGCGMQTNSQSTAFCETFDSPSAGGGRTGQLNPAVWTVSRMFGFVNIGVPFPFPKTTIDACGVPQSVAAGNDIQICNGRMYESTNDNPTGGDQAGSVLSLSMSAKQPFDFANRTGTVAFDVTNDTAGTHSAWPEFWITESLTANPFTHFGAWQSLPQNGFGVRFGAAAPPGQPAACPSGDTSKWRWTVDSAIVVRNWIVEDNSIAIPGYSPYSQCADNFATSCVTTGMTVTVLDCVTQPDISLGPKGGMNHVELKISKDQIDVYATDAGTTAPLKKIAVITKADLKFSRGYISLEDAHFNADKGPEERPKQRIHTFAWDNVAFDGPVLARAVSADVSDSLLPSTSTYAPNSVYLGWDVSASQPVLLTTTATVTAAHISAATKATVVFNYFSYAPPSSFTVLVNGGGNPSPTARPFNDTAGYGLRSMAVDVPLTALKSGANIISIKSDQQMIIANVSLVLPGAGGVVNPK